MDQGCVQQLAPRRFGGDLRLLLGCDRERLVPAAEQEQPDEQARAEVRLPASVAAATREGDRPLAGVDRVGKAVQRLENDHEVVLGPEGTGVHLLCVRHLDGRSEEDPRFGQPALSEDDDRFAVEGLDEDLRSASVSARSSSGAAASAPWPPSTCERPSCASAAASA